MSFMTVLKFNVYNVKDNLKVKCVFMHLVFFGTPYMNVNIFNK